MEVPRIFIRSIDTSENVEIEEIVSALAREIVSEEFSEIAEVIDVETITDTKGEISEENTLRVDVNVEINTENLVVGGRYDSGKIIERYYEMKDGAINNIMKKRKEGIMTKVGLAPENYKLRIVGVTTELTVSTMMREMRDTEVTIGDIIGYSYVNVKVGIIMSIEDITGYEPGGDQALRIRYNALCKAESMYGMDELQKWAKEIGIRKIEEKDKIMLCQEIREYYGW